MKTHYFNQEQADEDDMFLKMAIAQGYVPKDCKLGGQAVMAIVNGAGRPCDGCACSRSKCGGKAELSQEAREDT